MNQVHLALLRGINVTGYKVIKMADLKAMFIELGHQKVETYIQSGNVVFTPSKNDDALTISLQIEQAIQERYQFEVSVLVLSSQELQKVVESNPFMKRENIETEKLYVTFLSKTPEPAQAAVLNEVLFPPEEFVLHEKAVYIHCTNGYGNTKLTNLLFEKKLKTTATTRNWKTVNKLLEMLS